MQKIISALILGIILGLASTYYYYQHKLPDSISVAPTATSTGEALIGTSTLKKKKLVTVGGITFETDADNPGSIQLEQITTGELPKPIPSLTEAISFSVNITPEVKAAITKNSNQLRAELAKDPWQTGKWLTLGIYYKMADDFPRAVTAWEYVTKLAPNDKIAYNNLADLYQYYLKQPNKAETNWMKTITLDSTYVPGFRGLYDLYTQTKQLDKALTILKQGIAKNPHSIELKVVLGDYYRSLKNTTEARVEYEAAMTEAKLIKNQAIIDSIQQTIDGLK